MDVWPTPSNPPRVFLRHPRVTQVLGAALPVAAIEKYLVAIGGTVLNKPEDAAAGRGRPGMAAGSGRRNRPHRGSGPAPRVRQLPDRPAPLSGWAASAMARWTWRFAACERAWRPSGCSRPSHCRWVRSEGEGSVRLLNPLSSEEAWLRQNAPPGPDPRGPDQLVGPGPRCPAVRDRYRVPAGRGWAVARRNRRGSRSCSLGPGRPPIGPRVARRRIWICGISNPSSRRRSLWQIRAPACKFIRMAGSRRRRMAGRWATPERLAVDLSGMGGAGLRSGARAECRAAVGAPLLPIAGDTCGMAGPDAAPQVRHGGGGLGCE